MHPLNNTLADTWWFGLTHRMGEDRFAALAARRRRDGFTAVQIVAGVPPEVGPCHPNARSAAGFPWTITGGFNRDYLALAAERIAMLNAAGLTAIVYGAWGYQVDWLGVGRMEQWWKLLVEHLDHLDVVYCVSGESNLAVDGAPYLLPDRATDCASAVRRWFGRFRRHRWREARRRNWSRVLDTLSRFTDRPILLHPIWQETAFEAVTNPQRLAANTAQTAHDEASRHRIWDLPLQMRVRQPPPAYLNLEPWYEGILDRFGTADQLFAYWSSMLAGAIGHGYGAHGIWNIGDGAFLTHWGGQTFETAVGLETPRLLGASHAEFVRHCTGNDAWQPQVESGENVLYSIGRRWADGTSATFYPDVAQVGALCPGRIWDPLRAGYAAAAPAAGPVVVFGGGDGS